MGRGEASGADFGEGGGDGFSEAFCAPAAPLAEELVSGVDGGKALAGEEVAEHEGFGFVAGGVVNGFTDTGAGDGVGKGAEDILIGGCDFGDTGEAFWGESAEGFDGVAEALHGDSQGMEVLFGTDAVGGLEDLLGEALESGGRDVAEIDGGFGEAKGSDETFDAGLEAGAARAVEGGHEVALGGAAAGLQAHGCRRRNRARSNRYRKGKRAQPRCQHSPGTR